MVYIEENESIQNDLIDILNKMNIPLLNDLDEALDRLAGKTYSSLWWSYSNNIPIIYMKRTNDDVDLLCTGGDNPDLQADLDPFVPLNRDFGWNIQMQSSEWSLSVDFIDYEIG